MKALFKLAILGALIWAAITYGGPYIERISTGIAGGAGAIDGRSSTCIRSAFDASETFGKAVTSLRVPPDMNAWGADLDRSRASFERASLACDCFDDEGGPTPACDEAKKGLEELDGFMRAMDEGLRQGRPLLNAPRFQERVDEHLNRARELARGR